MSNKRDQVSQALDNVASDTLTAFRQWADSQNLGAQVGNDPLRAHIALQHFQGNSLEAGQIARFGRTQNLDDNRLGELVDFGKSIRELGVPKPYTLDSLTGSRSGGYLSEKGYNSLKYLQDTVLGSADKLDEFRHFSFLDDDAKQTAMLSFMERSHQVIGWDRGAGTPGTVSLRNLAENSFRQGFSQAYRTNQAIAKTEISTPWGGDEEATGLNAMDVDQFGNPINAGFLNKQSSFENRFSPKTPISEYLSVSSSKYRDTFGSDWQSYAERYQGFEANEPVPASQVERWLKQAQPFQSRLSGLGKNLVPMPETVLERANKALSAISGRSDATDEQIALARRQVTDAQAQMAFREDIQNYNLDLAEEAGVPRNLAPLLLFRQYGGMKETRDVTERALGLSGGTSRMDPDQPAVRMDFTGGQSNFADQRVIGAKQRLMPQAAGSGIRDNLKALNPYTSQGNASNLAADMRIAKRISAETYESPGEIRDINQPIGESGWRNITFSDYLNEPMVRVAGSNQEALNNMGLVDERPYLDGPEAEPVITSGVFMDDDPARTMRGDPVNRYSFPTDDARYAARISAAESTRRDIRPAAGPGRPLDLPEPTYEPTNQFSVIGYRGPGTALPGGDTLSEGSYMLSYNSGDTTFVSASQMDTLMESGADLSLADGAQVPAEVAAYIGGTSVSASAAKAASQLIDYTLGRQPRNSVWEDPSRARTGAGGPGRRTGYGGGPAVPFAGRGDSEVRPTTRRALTPKERVAQLRSQAEDRARGLPTRSPDNKPVLTPVQNGLDSGRPGALTGHLDPAIDPLGPLEEPASTQGPLLLGPGPMAVPEGPAEPPLYYMGFDIEAQPTPESIQVVRDRVARIAKDGTYRLALGDEGRGLGRVAAQAANQLGIPYTVFGNGEGTTMKGADFVKLDPTGDPSEYEGTQGQNKMRADRNNQILDRVAATGGKAFLMADGGLSGSDKMAPPSVRSQFNRLTEKGIPGVFYDSVSKTSTQTVNAAGEGPNALHEAGHAFVNSVLGGSLHSYEIGDEGASATLNLPQNAEYHPPVYLGGYAAEVANQPANAALPEVGDRYKSDVEQWALATGRDPSEFQGAATTLSRELRPHIGAINAAATMMEAGADNVDEILKASTKGVTLGITDAPEAMPGDRLSFANGRAEYGLADETTSGARKAGPRRHRRVNREEYEKRIRRAKRLNEAHEQEAEAAHATEMQSWNEAAGGNLTDGQLEQLSSWVEDTRYLNQVSDLGGQVSALDENGAITGPDVYGNTGGTRTYTAKDLPELRNRFKGRAAAARKMHEHLTSQGLDINVVGAMVGAPIQAFGAPLEEPNAAQGTSGLVAERDIPPPDPDAPGVGRQRTRLQDLAGMHDPGSMAGQAVAEALSRGIPQSSSAKQSIELIAKAVDDALTAVTRQRTKELEDQHKSGQLSSADFVAGKRALDEEKNNARSALSETYESLEQDSGGNRRGYKIRQDANDSFMRVGTGRSGKEMLDALAESDPYFRAEIEKRGGSDRLSKQAFMIPGQEGGFGISSEGPYPTDGGRGLNNGSFWWGMKHVKDIFRATVGGIEQEASRAEVSERPYAIGAGVGFGPLDANRQDRIAGQNMIDRASADQFDYLLSTPARLAKNNYGVAQAFSSAQLAGGLAMLGMAPKMLGMEQMGELGARFSSVAEGAGILGGAAVMGAGLGTALVNSTGIGSPYGHQYSLTDSAHTIEQTVFGWQAMLDPEWARATIENNRGAAWVTASQQKGAIRDRRAGAGNFINETGFGSPIDKVSAEEYYASQSVSILNATGFDPLAASTFRQSYLESNAGALERTGVRHDIALAQVRRGAGYQSLLNQDPAERLMLMSGQYAERMGGDAGDYSSSATKYAAGLGYQPGTKEYLDASNRFLQSGIGADGSVDPNAAVRNQAALGLQAGFNSASANQLLRMGFDQSIVGNLSASLIPAQMDRFASLSNTFYSAGADPAKDTRLSGELAAYAAAGNNFQIGRLTSSVGTLLNYGADPLTTLRNSASLPIGRVGSYESGIAQISQLGGDVNDPTLTGRIADLSKWTAPSLFNQMIGATGDAVLGGYSIGNALDLFGGLNSQQISRASRSINARRSVGADSLNAGVIRGNALNFNDAEQGVGISYGDAYSESGGSYEEGEAIGLGMLRAGKSRQYVGQRGGMLSSLTGYGLSARDADRYLGSGSIIDSQSRASAATLAAQAGLNITDPAVLAMAGAGVAGRSGLEANSYLSSVTGAISLGMTATSAFGAFSGMNIPQMGVESGLLSSMYGAGLNINSASNIGMARTVASTYNARQAGQFEAGANELMGLGANAGYAYQSMASLGPMSNLDSRNFNRLLGGDSYAISAFARTSYGQSLGAVETVNGQGQPIYQAQQWALQAQEHAVGYQSQQWSFDVQGQRLAQNSAMTFGGSFFNPATGQTQTVGGGGRLGLSEREFALSVQKQQYDFGIQERQIGISSARFYEGMGVQQKQSAKEYQWQQQDWTYGEQTAQTHFGWAMEDYDREIRFSRGRDRRQLERQRDRAVVDETMREGHSQDEKSRIDERRKWELESQDRQKRYFEEDKKLQQERLDKDKEFFAVSRAFGEERLQLQRTEAQLSQYYGELELQHSRAVAAQNEALYQQQVYISHAAELANQAQRNWYENEFPRLLATGQVNMKNVWDSTARDLGDAMTPKVKQLVDLLNQAQAVQVAQQSAEAIIQLIMSQFGGILHLFGGGIGGLLGGGSGNNAQIAGLLGQIAQNTKGNGAQITIHTNDVKTALSAVEDVYR